jgi:hypothetical protein
MTRVKLRGYSTYGKSKLAIIRPTSRSRYQIRRCGRATFFSPRDGACARCLSSYRKLQVKHQVAICSLKVSVLSDHTPWGAATPAPRPWAAPIRPARLGRDHAREHQSCSPLPAPPSSLVGVGLSLRSPPALVSGGAACARADDTIAWPAARRRIASDVSASASPVHSYRRPAQRDVSDAGRRNRRWQRQRLGLSPSDLLPTPRSTATSRIRGRLCLIATVLKDVLRVRRDPDIG